MNEDVKAMVEAIERAVDDGSCNLSDWEEGFLKTIKRYAAEGIALTDRQDAALERLWKKATQ